jgi:hypothetical protein
LTKYKRCAKYLSQSTGSTKAGFYPSLLERAAEKQEPLDPRSGEQRYIAKASAKLEISGPWTRSSDDPQSKAHQVVQMEYSIQNRVRSHRTVAKRVANGARVEIKKSLVNYSIVLAVLSRILHM